MTNKKCNQKYISLNYKYDNYNIKKNITKNLHNFTNNFYFTHIKKQM